MKDILLTTWISSDNYGSLLQAYCLKYIIENVEIFSDKKMPHELNVYLLNHYENQKNQSQKVQSISFKKVLNGIYNKIWRLYFKKQAVNRAQKFENFKIKKLNLYPKRRYLVNGVSDLERMKKFDLYVAGSDQIWNPKLLNWVYLLDWAPNNRPRISYASSVCVDQLSRNELKRYRPLDKFEAISVREYTESVRQISEFVHKKIIEVVDPVLLYGRRAMLKHCKKNIAGKYMLVYMLHDNAEVRDYYSRLAKKSGLKLKILPYTRVNSLLSEVRMTRIFQWDADPFDFVNLIYNSEILVTDSYHGVITALLLHKEFILIPRSNGPSQQNNRLESLLKKLKLANHLDVRPNSIEEGMIINWDEVDNKLENMRKQSMNYLIRALKSALKDQ